MVAIPDIEIRKLISNGTLRVEGSKDIQPASIDIGFIENELFHTDFSSNSFDGNFRRKHVTKLGSLDGSILLPGNLYIVKGPHIELPDSIEGYIEPKSTVGRLGLSVDLVVDGESSQTNFIPRGSDVDTYFVVEVRGPKMIFKPKDKVAQIRFRQVGTGFKNNRELRDSYPHSIAHFKPKPGVDMFGKSRITNLRDFDIVPRDEAIRGDSLILTADTRFALMLKDGVKEPIVYSKKESADIEDYWDVVLNANRYLDVPRGKLMLIGSHEFVKVGHDVCARMGMKTEGLNIHVETHRAGFIDNNFNGIVTAEFYNYQYPLKLWHGKYMSNLSYETVDPIPKTVYGSGKRNNYQGQVGALPPKQFKRHRHVYKDVISGRIKPILRGAKDIGDFRKKNTKTLS